MKKILFLFIAAVAVTSCSVEDANTQEQVVITSLSDEVFINYMEADALGDGLISEPINADASVYPLGIQSITTNLDAAKNGSVDPDFGACIIQPIVDSSTGVQLAEFSITKVKDENDNDNTKFKYNVNTIDGWYVYSIMMNITEDCADIPVNGHGVPNVCRFNVRNCFGNGVTNVTYNFRDACIRECTCNAVYVLLYNLDENGCRDRQVGIWVNGDQFGNTSATTNTYCKSDCGDDEIVIIIDD